MVGIAAYILILIVLTAILRLIGVTNASIEENLRERHIPPKGW